MKKGSISAQKSVFTLLINFSIPSTLLRHKKSDFNHSIFVAWRLEEFGDLEFSTSIVTNQESFEIFYILLNFCFSD